MQKTNFLKELVSNLTLQITAAIPESLNEECSTLRKDIERHCKRIITKTCAKLDVVTREEFDVQTNVLLRTRKKLEALQKQLDEMTEQLHAAPKKGNKKHHE